MKRFKERGTRPEHPAPLRQVVLYADGRANVASLVARGLVIRIFFLGHSFDWVGDFFQRPVAGNTEREADEGL